MRILMTGATGFLGKALVLRLLRDGCGVTALVRNEEKARNALGSEVSLATYGDADALRRAVEGADAIVNLAGEPIFPGRWAEERKRSLAESRVGLTRRLVDAVAAASPKPKALVSASAVGYYGDRGAELLDESAASGADFAAGMCRDWEAETARAGALGLRTAAVRIGVVLGREGGALAPFLPLFRAGLGGPVGSGRQLFPWIHLEDLVEVLRNAALDDRYTGAINGVAPNPVPNAEFARALGRALGRPAILPVPAFALRAAFGEASILPLGGQNVAPKKLRELGFAWRFPLLEDALDDLLGDAGVTIEPARDTPDSDYLRARRPTHVLSTRTALDAPLETVFDFFSKAENLGAITPPWLGFAIRTPRPIAMREGAALDYTIRLGPASVNWRTRIERWNPPESFVDVQERGPYACWRHEHRFSSDGRRTVMEDRVRYAAPMGALGRAANALYVAGTLRRIFGYRAAAIRLRFGSTS